MSLLPAFLHSPEVPPWIALLCLGVAAASIGIGKAGVGDGVGLVAPALFAQVMPMREVLGLMQPLLMVGDAAALKAWWGKWDVRNFLLLLPGTVAGVALGALLLSRLSNRYLQIGLGLISLVFVALQLLRARGFVTGASFRPVWWQGALIGTAAGLCSTLAHAAGPIVALYLLPQNLGKERFVATTVLYYAVLNAIKLPVLIGSGVVTTRLALSALWLVPAIVLGTLLGVWFNRRFSERLFATVIYVLVVLTALKLLLG